MGPSQNILGVLILTKFEVTKMARIIMATQVKDLLSSYSLYDKLIAYVKDGVVAIYPPSYKLSILWSHVAFWDL
jgi:hypothetical protein